MIDPDIFWMHHALTCARQAATMGEVPVGAVLVENNRLLARSWNQSILCHDPTAHAEILALRTAGQLKQNYRLPHLTLYVTLEPCLMCVGALLHARISRLVFGAFDPKTGAVCSVHSLLDHASNNHKIRYLGGVLRTECGQYLSDFFKARRR
jgi:tRNA(adenine34) deaminase